MIAPDGNNMEPTTWKIQLREGLKWRLCTSIHHLENPLMGKNQRRTESLLNHWTEESRNMDVHIIAGDVASGLLVAMRFLIVAIAIMTQRIILMSTGGIDMTCHAVKSQRLYAHFVALSKRFSKFVLTVVFAWGNTSAIRASYLMMIYLRDNFIAMAVAFAGLEGVKTFSTATSVVAATQFC